jgi:two-component system OmpR family response regulator
MVVDRMMPRLDGVTMVEMLRKEGDQTPVLFLSALGEINHRVEGLKAGGDDYLVKPYAFAELIARVEALARRRETGSVQTLLRVGELEMDLIAREVRRRGQEIDLQPREFQLLEFLMRHAGQSVTRTMLLERVWEYHFDPQTNVIDVHISRLRSKIDKGFDRPMLQTVRGAGYRLEA